MIYNNKGEEVNVKSGNGITKTFFIGEEIVSYSEKFYGLKGYIQEIRTEGDRDASKSHNSFDEIVVDYEVPIDTEAEERVEKLFRHAYERGDVIVPVTPRKYTHKLIITSKKGSLDLSDIDFSKVKTIEEVSSFMDRYDGVRIKGLSSQCRNWIHAWGNGGGDSSSEECIKDKLDGDNDLVSTIADESYNAIIDYTHDEYESADIVITMIEDSIHELMS